MSADPLVAFWAARLDEDEAAAKAAWPGPWDLETEIGGFGPVSCVLMPIPQHKGARTGLTSFTPLGTQDAGTAAHIARHDPARVLREVEAGRRLIALHRPEWNDYVDGDGIERTSLECGEYEPGGSPDNWPCPTVRVCIAIWDVHPDYRQEWKPRP